ncbi:E3 ubiquitin-protein ligase SINA-like 7 [Triticum urartu]|uniref:E3 ubiquitin-protein ligase SINA-like 7 n=1 Tax=Triticum urartu TaxID=4572 RepID=UPI0020446BF5|nr:E3 ubiquitin-protein ligase SINA-like 7 [Triticum urartu]
MQRHAGDELTISVDPDTLDCPICFHTLRPPVFQCAAGHVLCSSCHDRLRQSRKCPECSVATGFSRCYAVDRILRAVRVPCPNAARGCAVQTSLHEREEHEKSCALLLRHGLATVTINDNAKAGEVVRMGPCGGGGGNARKIGMVGEVTRIVQVAVRHCALLLRHGLATVTINDNAKVRRIRPYATSDSDSICCLASYVD